MYLGPPLLGAWIFAHIMSSSQTTQKVIITFFVSYYNLCVKSMLTWYKDSHISQFSFGFHLYKISFPIPSLLVCVCLYIWNESLIGSIETIKKIFFLPILFHKLSLLFFISFCLLLWSGEFHSPDLELTHSSAFSILLLKA